MRGDFMMYLEFKDEEIKRAQKLLKGCKNGFPKALYRALNDTSTSTKEELVKLARERYNYKVAALRNRITIDKCSSYKFLNASTRSVGPQIHLTDILSTRQTKKGVIVNVKKSTGQKLIPHAFIQPKKTSAPSKDVEKQKSSKKKKKRIVYIRETVGGKLVPRYDISPMYASHPEVIYNTPENWAPLSTRVQKAMDKHFEREIDAILRGF